MCTIFFVIALAFDKVCHNGLLYKLIQLKFSNHIVSWIKDFLENRFFVVRVGNVATVNFEIKAGVIRKVSSSVQSFSPFLSMICQLSIKKTSYTPC